MTEIEKTEAKIKVLQAKLELLKEMEKHKSPEPTTLYDALRKLDRPMFIDDVLGAVEKWLPKEQSAAGSQNAYVECSVEGFNDCLTQIKSKLR